MVQLVGLVALLCKQCGALL